MISRNNTDFPDRELDLILHFVDPDEMLKKDGDIIITGQDGDERCGSPSTDTAADTPTEPDPSLAETTRYLNNFREERKARMKSKLAEMAEADKAGKGL